MEKGFTLIELLVTIVLVAILAVLAMPSFKSLIIGNRLATEINDFIGDLHLARTEAVKRGDDVIICSANTALTACNTSPAGNWAENGWIILATDASSTLIKAHQPFVSDALMDVSVTDGKITFNRYGFAPNSARTIRLCAPSKHDTDARGVIVSTSGRIILASDTDTVTPDSIVNDNTGTNLDCGA